MYLRRRLRSRQPGRFVEVGVGDGSLSAALLEWGWNGQGWDLSPAAIEMARHLNEAEFAAGRYDVRLGDWLSAPPERTDLVVAAMVLEHIPDDIAFLARCRLWSSQLILFVPASPAHWGIEDEIAGHARRYTREILQQRLTSAGFTVTHLAGLTYPLSNLLLPVSNLLVRWSESDKRMLSPADRTVLSGVRAVPFKTSFPAWSTLLLNRATLWPFHLAQLASRESEAALVLYVEALADS
jgi:SAM-dependent methyltransferase